MSLDWLDSELLALAANDLLRERTIRSSNIGPEIVVRGKSYLNFASNDYLGLAGDAVFAEQIQSQLDHYGWGSGASPLVVGRHEVHARLESELADFLNTEAALLFPSGFAANAGTIPALVGDGDVIFSDAKNHASIIDGCRLSRARTTVFEHANLDDLAGKLSSAESKTNDEATRGSWHEKRRRLIVTDSLFSMDGDFADLAKLVELAEEYNAMLMVDEAHAFGVVGASGAGACELQGVGTQVPIRVGTLSKSLGSHGGFVAGSDKLISYLAHRARSYVFSTAAPVAASVAALAALQIIRQEPERRQRVLGYADRVRTSLHTAGWRLSSSPSSHIVAVVVGEATSTVRLANQLRDAGIWVACIRPPSVPDGESLLRISLSSSHTPKMIDRLLETFAQTDPTFGSP